MYVCNTGLHDSLMGAWLGRAFELEVFALPLGFFGLLGKKYKYEDFLKRCSEWSNSPRKLETLIFLNWGQGWTISGFVQLYYYTIPN